MLSWLPVSLVTPQSVTKLPATPPVQSAVAMHVMGSVSPANNIEGLSFHEDIALAEAMSPPSSLRFEHSSKNGPTSLDNPPPPPPPAAPLPPPPPPPPPLLPTAPGGHPDGLKKKKRVRSFFWKTIPAEQVKGRANLWTQGQVQQDFQIDVETIEELFTQNDGPPASTASLIRGGKARVSFREAKDEVSILDSKRALNIAIFLKQFKRSNQALVDDIHHGNSESLGAEHLRELLKLLPEKEEVKKLRAYRGDVSQLSLADSFVYLLTQLPSYSVRVESMLLKEEFPASCEAMKQGFKTLRSAAKELMCCKELHAVLHLVLQAGNILNAGGSAGNAVGFKLSSLLSLADTKSNKPGMNLLHIVALEAQKKDEKLLEFPLKLSNIQAASRISVETLDAELKLLTSRTRSVEESIQKDTELLQQLDGFLQSATTSLCSLRGSQQQLRREGRELVDFFCEDRDTFRLDDCFCVFHTFCTRFTNAVKENKEREAKEAARQRMREEELKRHSWSGGEEVRGAFGGRCSSETDMSAWASRDEAGFLLDLLSPRPQPRSPLNSGRFARTRSGNSQRSRNSPSSSPSLAAERELSALLTMSGELKVPRQRGKEDTRKPVKPEPQGSGPTGVSASSPAVSQTHPETSSSRKHENANSMDSAYLKAYHKDVSAASDEDEVPVKSTSDSSQQRSELSSQEERPDDPAESCLTIKTSNKGQSAAAAAGSLSVSVETCTLVAELKAFDSTVTHQPDDAMITSLEDLEAEGADRVRNTSLETEKTSSSAQEENTKEPEVKVIVWCVTGVCEAAGENVRPRTEKDENRQPSSAAADRDRADAQTATEDVPISSQPVPASRGGDPSMPVSSLGPHPVKPAAEGLEPAPACADPVSAGPDATRTAEAPEKRDEGTDLVSEAEDSTDQRTPAGPRSEQTKKTLRQRTVEGSSPGGKTKPPTSTASSSTKKLLNSRTGCTGTTQSKGTSTGGRSIRTLTGSENQSMRRVVPITRSIPGSWPRDRTAEKPAASTRSSSRTAAHSNPNSSSVRRGERPGAAPSSQRSGSAKTPQSKEPREQNQDLQGRPSVRKAAAKPRTQTEEKMCLSKLRALNQVGGGGRGGSVSAPVTPLHKSRTPPSSALPGFARNTASSSFRRTKPPLAASSLKSSPKTSSSSSAPSAASSSSVSKTASSSCRSTDRPNASSSSPPRRSQSTRSSAPSPPRASLAPPKGHKRNDSGSLSDKSTHSRDWSKASRPSWR